MFDLDAFLAECQDALAGPDPLPAVRAALTRAVEQREAVGDVLRPTQAGITLLHHAPDVTVLHVVWAPHMRLFPHDHRMWAAIGVYAGQEDNTFFRRPAPRQSIVESGGKELATGDVVLLGDDTIHAVANPSDRLTGAIHIYGGDFVNEPRSQWDPDSLAERPYDLAATMEEFAAANRSWLGTS